MSEARFSALDDGTLSRVPIHPPRAEFLPGLRLSRAAAGRAFVFPLAIVLLFALMPLMILFTDESAMLSVLPTETTMGRVLQTQRTQGCAGNGVQIGYSFPANRDTPFRGQDTVCPRTPYASVREGDSIPVVYLSRNPAVNAIAGSRRASEPPFPVFFIFPLFALLFVAPLFWPRYSQLLRDRRLFRTGILARGRVVFVARRQDSWFPGWPMFPRSEVHVRARLPSGEEREVKAVCTNDWLLSHLPPAAEVTVVCHPRRPRAVLLENYLR